jgi:hypothetical protein
MRATLVQRDQVSPPPEKQKCGRVLNLGSARYHKNEPSVGAAPRAAYVCTCRAGRQSVRSNKQWDKFYVASTTEGRTLGGRSHAHPSSCVVRSQKRTRVARLRSVQGDGWTSARETNRGLSPQTPQFAVMRVVAPVIETSCYNVRAT